MQHNSHDRPKHSQTREKLELWWRKQKKISSRCVSIRNNPRGSKTYSPMPQHRAKSAQILKVNFERQKPIISTAKPIFLGSRMFLLHNPTFLAHFLIFQSNVNFSTCFKKISEIFGVEVLASSVDLKYQEKNLKAGIRDPRRR